MFSYVFNPPKLYSPSRNILAKGSADKHSIEYLSSTLVAIISREFHRNPFEVFLRRKEICLAWDEKRDRQKTGQAEDGRGKVKT